MSIKNANLWAVSLHLTSFLLWFPRVDSPISAQELLSRIKQEEHQCVWDQQDLAERDIPTDPNSGEQDNGRSAEGYLQFPKWNY